MTQTRPDIAFATSVVSRFAQNPGQEHLNAARQIIIYLYHTRFYAIQYGGGEMKLVGWSDSDYAGDATAAKSTSGYVFTLNGGPITWASKRQTVVALSSTEAEYIALSETAKEAAWLRLLLTELRVVGENEV